jgi:FMN reductase
LKSTEGVTLAEGTFSALVVPIRDLGKTLPRCYRLTRFASSPPAISKAEVVRLRRGGRIAQWALALPARSRGNILSGPCTNDHTMPHITLISGSPSPASRSAYLLDLVKASLDSRQFATRRIDVRQLPLVPLVAGDTGDQFLQAVLDDVATADALVVATPIYKASYSGLLKIFLDLLPQNALVDKFVLPIATGGSLAHLLALDYALKPVIWSLGARHMAANLFAVEGHIPKQADGSYSIEPELGERIGESVEQLAQVLDERAESRLRRTAAEDSRSPHAKTQAGKRVPARGTALYV